MNRAKEVKSRETIPQPRKRHSEALSNKFYWIYQESDVFDDKEILFIDSRTIVRESTTIEQAKREVQSYIRSIGGNTAMHLKVGRRESWLSYTPRYTVSANAALVVPKTTPDTKKVEVANAMQSAASATKTGNPINFLKYIVLTVLSVIVLKIGISSAIWVLGS